MRTRIIIIAVLVATIFGLIKYLTIDSINQAENSKPVFKTTAEEIVNKSTSNKDFLKPYLDKVIELDGTVCEFFVYSDTEYYLELSSSVQKDTCVLVSRPLRASTLKSKPIWEPCDSSVAIVHNLFNMQENKTKLFIKAYVHHRDTDTIPSFTFNKNCKGYNRHYPNNIPHYLENFCHDKVRLKGVLASVKTTGDSLFLDIETGYLLEKIKLDHKMNYRKRL